MVDRILKVGDYVKHFKCPTSASLKEQQNYCYKIIAMNVKHTETTESLVVYQAMYGVHQIYARPTDMFLGLVDKDKYPDILQQYRLEKIEDEELLKLLIEEDSKI